MLVVAKGRVLVVAKGRGSYIELFLSCPLGPAPTIDSHSETLPKETKHYSRTGPTSSVTGHTGLTSSLSVTKSL